LSSVISLVAFPFASSAPAVATGAALPASVDWSSYVPTVQDQGTCGADFAVVDAMNYYIKIFYHIDLQLSLQQIIDCSMDDYGCDGTNVVTEYKYIMSNNGLATNASYPYVMQNWDMSQPERNNCTSSSDTMAATITNYTVIAANDVQGMMQAVALHPIVASIDSSQDTFQTYTSGVYVEPACTTNGDHLVLIVGYGTTPEGVNYWIAKNSWGQNWGDNGYFKVQRGNNTCGIESSASYPIASPLGKATPSS